jgi:hypothetical protein
MEKRSNYLPFLERRTTSKVAGALDIIPSYDAEGSKYLATREAVNKSSDMEAMKNVAKALGMAGLMGASSYMATKLPVIGGKYLIPAALYGSLSGGGKLMNYLDDPSMLTVPAHTIAKKVAAMLSKEDAPRMAKIAQEPMNYMYPTMPMVQPESMTDRLWGWAKENPGLASFLGLMGAGIGLKGLGAASKGIQRGWKSFVNPVEANIENLVAKPSSTLQSANALAEGTTKSPIIPRAQYNKEHADFMDRFRKQQWANKGPQTPESMAELVHKNNLVPPEAQGLSWDDYVSFISGKQPDPMKMPYPTHPMAQPTMSPVEALNKVTPPGQVRPIEPKLGSLADRLLDRISK